MNVLICTKNKVLSDSWQNALVDKEINKISKINKFWDFLNNLNKPIIIFLDIEWQKDIKLFLQEINEEQKDIRVLVFSQKPSFNEGRELLDFGIRGYANSFMQDIHIQDAYECIEKGNVWLYPEFIQSMINLMRISKPLAQENIVSLENLTNREQEIVKLISDGLSNQNIAEICGITPRTVKAHTKSIYEKLNVKDRIGLVILMQNLLS